LPSAPDITPGTRASRRDEQRRRVAASAAGGGAVVVGLFVVGVLLGLLVVHRHGGGPIQPWDRTVEGWDVHHRAGLVGVAKVIAFLGDAPKLGAISVILSAAWLALRRTLRGLVPIAGYLGGEFQVFLIREVIHRPRPPTANFPAPGAVPGVHETSFSFPSGHSVAVTAVLFACFGVLALARRWWWPWVVAALASMFVCDTRLVLGVHWFSDVAFGLPLGVAWGVTVAVVALRLEWADLRACLPGPRRRPRS
jgi:membrane-associated phospholipid phosphatase